VIELLRELVEIESPTGDTRAIRDRTAAELRALVFFDLSLTIPHVSRPVEALREALELAPISKLLYASDAARTPELYFVAATWWRDALAEVLDDEDDARLILRENARTLYRL
jgi:predicted TIM-barrel fold metal-dependent hydrolase